MRTSRSSFGFDVSADKLQPVHVFYHLSPVRINRCRDYFISERNVSKLIYQFSNNYVGLLRTIDSTFPITATVCRSPLFETLNFGCGNVIAYRREIGLFERLGAPSLTELTLVKARELSKTRHRRMAWKIALSKCRIKVRRCVN